MRRRNCGAVRTNIRRNMSDTSIDYEGLAQDALRGVVRSVLDQVARNGLPANHHFFIAFNTRAPDVGISKRLREQYPEEMTIVLQHRFWDLQVHDDRFEVKLTFGGIPERLVVPFRAIKVFFDPSAHYGLQFEPSEQTPTTRRRKVKLDVITQDRDGPGEADFDIDLGAIAKIESVAGADKADTVPAVPVRPAAAKAAPERRPQPLEKKKSRRDGDDADAAAVAAKIAATEQDGKLPGQVAASEAGAAVPSEKPTADVVSLDAFRKK